VAQQPLILAFDDYDGATLTAYWQTKQRGVKPWAILEARCLPKSPFLATSSNPQADELGLKAREALPLSDR